MCPLKEKEKGFPINFIRMSRTFVNVVQLPECDEILCEDSVTLHHDVIGSDLSDASFKIADFDINCAALKRYTKSRQIRI